MVEAEQMFRAAKQYGLAIKLHSDQFHCIGGAELGIRFGALSIDHLEASGPKQIAEIAASSTIATILPGVSLHLGTPAAPGRKLIDAGAAIAVGTDLNPGSSPLFSTSTALALAVRLNGLTAQEALVAGTVNAASALGLMDTGRVEAGCAADFLVLHSSDWREVVYALGTNPVREVWIGGRSPAMNTLYRPELLYSNDKFISNAGVLVGDNGKVLETPENVDASSTQTVDLREKHCSQAS